MIERERERERMIERDRVREGRRESDNLGVAVCSYRYSQLISTYNFNLYDRAGTFASKKYKAEFSAVPGSGIALLLSKFSASENLRERSIPLGHSRKRSLQ